MCVKTKLSKTQEEKARRDGTCNELYVCMEHEEIYSHKEDSMIQMELRWINIRLMRE